MTLIETSLVSFYADYGCYNTLHKMTISNIYTTIIPLIKLILLVTLASLALGLEPITDPKREKTENFGGG